MTSPVSELANLRESLYQLVLRYRCSSKWETQDILDAIDALIDGEPLMNREIEQPRAMFKVGDVVQCKISGRTMVVLEHSVPISSQRSLLAWLRGVPVKAPVPDYSRVRVSFPLDPPRLVHRSWVPGSDRYTVTYQYYESTVFPTALLRPLP